MSTPAIPSTVRAVSKWTTPRLLQTALILIWAAALLFFGVALAGVRATRSVVQTVGKDAVPSILAAQRLKVSLSDLDANVVNELIVPPGTSASSIKGYVTRRQEITDSLIRAAENITYDDLERKPITDLTNALSAFERLAIKARTLHQRGDARGTVSTYRDALTQLHGSLLPAADRLAKANTDALRRRESSLGLQTGILTTLTVLTAFALLAALVGTQLLLSQRTRRTLNPALLAASVVAVLTAVTVLRAFSGVKEEVRVAREDAFQSLSILWQARSLAYDANSDESRWLFDRERRSDLEKDFFDKTTLLLKLPTGQSYDSFVAATSAASLPSGSKGLFAQELANITFAGEREAAQKTVRAYGVYYGRDRQIRALENAGQHAEAVRFCISLAPGDSNWAYARFDEALDETIMINQTAFEAAIEGGFRRLRGLDIGIPLAVLITGVLALVGIRPRLREYDV
ncbi:MAG: hypothetical protein H7Z41_02655 [Cytophagales bacterium]|nr:hypothetical protein [Armatimonadota bacterium]